MKKKILLIVGSLRKESFNKQLAMKASAILGKEADVELLDYEQVPLFNQDKEFPVPDAVKQVRRQVEDADGIWIFTPEYNHRIPGVLKNLLDWLSRPVAYGSPSSVAKKAVTFSGAGGFSGASSAQDELLFLLNQIGMDVVNTPRVSAAMDAVAFQNNQLTLNEFSEKVLEKQAKALIHHIS